MFSRGAHLASSAGWGGCREGNLLAEMSTICGGWANM